MYNTSESGVIMDALCLSSKTTLISSLSTLICACLFRLQIHTSVGVCVCVFFFNMERHARAAHMLAGGMQLGSILSAVWTGPSVGIDGEHSFP